MQWKDGGRFRASSAGGRRKPAGMGYTRDQPAHAGRSLDHNRRTQVLKLAPLAALRRFLISCGVHRHADATKHLNEPADGSAARAGPTDDSVDGDLATADHGVTG